MLYIAGVILTGTLLVAADVRVLYTNDLSATAGTSALLLGTTSGNNITSACAAYSEKPLSSVNNDVLDQLNYLTYYSKIYGSANVTQFYVGGNAAGTRKRRNAQLQARQGTACPAYSLVSRGIVNVDCSTALPVLCTNSPAPFSANDTAPANGSLLTAKGTGTAFNGYRDARSARFLGIPFAAPPTGSQRFQAAQAYNGSYANVTATRYGAPCIQVSSAFGQSAGASEDCLFLNVYTPYLPTSAAGNSSKLLPVYFWIYGGAFQEGAGSLSDYDGGNMASRGDVVVVTINYRVGLLGNLASSTLAGSQGITDQIQALKWVQRNIASFGGDPQHVTIAGQSAGGQSVVALLSSTPAKGLFQAAISESAPWNPFFNRGIYTNTGGMYNALLNATNCSGGDNSAQLTCLQSKNASTFISTNVTTPVGAASSAQQALYAQVQLLTSAVEPYLPVIGTGVVDDLFVNLVRNGTLPSQGIPLMIGNVQNEGILFVDSVPALASPLPFSNSTLNFILPNGFDPSTVAAIQNNLGTFAPNASDSDELRTLLGQLVTLDTWQCPLQQVLGYAKSANTFSSLYSYRFDKGYEQNSAFPSGCTTRAPNGYDAVCHAEDVLPVFGTSNVKGVPYTGGNSLMFSQYTQDVWTAFARTYNPQPATLYLQYRGRAYNNTLNVVSSAPFNQYTGDNSSTSIHIMDYPPRNSAPVYQAQCRILANAGFLYDNVKG